jgi:hypothetical protein
MEELASFCAQIDDPEALRMSLLVLVSLSWTHFEALFVDDKYYSTMFVLVENNAFKCVKAMLLRPRCQMISMPMPVLLASKCEAMDELLAPYGDLAFRCVILRMIE